MRLKNVPYAKEKLSSYPDIVIMNQSFKGKNKELFKNDNPIFVELGMGKGTFIIEMAKKYPNINFIGIEKYDSVLVRALEKLIDENISLSNLKLMRNDATNILDLFDKNEISELFINFCDPWPKKRHADRRLTSKIFINKYLDILKDEKIINFKTDNRKLFEFSLINFNDLEFDFLELSLNLHEDPIFNIETEFEKKFNQGPIYYLRVKKRF